MINDCDIDDLLCVVREFESGVRYSDAVVQSVYSKLFDKNIVCL